MRIQYFLQYKIRCHLRGSNVMLLFTALSRHMYIKALSRDY